VPDQRHRALGVDLEIIRNAVIEDPTVKSIQKDMVKLIEVATDRAVELSPDGITIKPIEPEAMEGLKEMLEHTQQRILGGFRMPIEFDKESAHKIDAMSYGFAPRMLGDKLVGIDLVSMDTLLKEEADMQWKDLEAALEFLPDSIGIVLQVQSAMDVPYVRRELLRTLGTPAKQYGDIMHYGNGMMIRIASVQSHDFEGYRAEQLFFIGRAHDDVSGLQDISPAIEPDKEIGYVMWRECGLCLADLANLLGSYANGKLSYYGYLDDDAPIR
jgi:hypothetical protein